MDKKKILVITPDTPDPSYIEHVVSPLAFLNEEYTIHPLDSLSISEHVSNSEYYDLWKELLKNYIPQYDAFFGFSFGGVIIQQCFSLFSSLNKPIVLFSTPSFADDLLTKKLNEVISLCKEHQVEKALATLYRHVYYPNSLPDLSYTHLNPDKAAQRVIFGLTRVLGTNSTQILKESDVNHLHLIGELSHLVNSDNVIAPKKGCLLKVPGAGMRMLRDNLPYCKKAIWEALHCKT